MERFDAELNNHREFTIKVPSSLSDENKSFIFDEIMRNVEKLNNPKEQDNNKIIDCRTDSQGNKLFITTKYVKQYYKVLSLLQLISTIYINYGIDYRVYNDEINTRGNNSRRGGGEIDDNFNLILVDDIFY